MSVFEFVNILFSIVLSIAFAHMLTTVAAMIRARSRVRFSCVHAAWMLNIFLVLVGNWIAIWDLRNVASWSVGFILLMTLMLVAQYLACALVSPEIPSEGEVDLRAFHDAQRRAYLSAFLALGAISVVINLVMARQFHVGAWALQNFAAVPMVLALGIATAIKTRWIEWAAAILMLAITVYTLAALVTGIG